MSAPAGEQPSEGGAPRPTRPAPFSRRLVVRLGILVASFGAAYVFMERFAPVETDLMVVVPAEQRDIQGLDVRVTREDGTQVLRARQPKLRDTRTVVLPVRLPRGELRLEAWTYGPGASVALEGRFTFEGTESVDVALVPRR